MMDAYPLTWPMGWPRTKYPARARFGTSFARARDELLKELNLLGADSVVISSNMELRRDGLPYTQQSKLQDIGIAVYFKLNGEDQCIPCDKWTTLADNLQAIRLTVGALRGLERWGAKEMVNAAFRGFKALPAGTGGARQWWDVLGVSQNASEPEIYSAYRTLLTKVHPDKGGTTQEFIEVQKAYKQSKEATK